MVEKDRSSIVNQTYLMKMIATFYPNHFRSQLSLGKDLLLKILLQIILQSIKQDCYKLLKHLFYDVFYYGN